MMNSLLALGLLPFAALAACGRALNRLRTGAATPSQPLAAPGAPAGLAGNDERPGVRIFNGRGGKDGPPDLDELWRDLNRKLSQLFSGGGSGGSGGDGGGPQMSELRGAGVGAALIGGLLVLVWVMSGVFIVQDGQQAVVMSFGRFSRIAEAGMQWRLPYPFETHEIVSVTAPRSVEVGSATVAASTGLRDSSMLTQDENIVDIRFTVQYRVKDVREYLFSNREPDGAVMRAAESAVREIVGRNSMDSVLYEQRDALAVDLVRLTQLQLDRLKAGVLISNVNVQSVQVPEPVQAAFDDASRAVADRERFKNEGQSYANEVLPKAQSAAVRLREEAQAWRARVVDQAEGDAERFRRIYDEYQKAPGVTRDRMYIDAMREIYSNTTKVLVDSRSGSNLLYLPLDKLLQQTGPVPASSAGAASSPAGGGAGAQVDLPSLPTAVPDARSRDVMRSRERELR